ncbi:hypothetical protein PPTG_19178 [Phytophthora nicotianae INRA-310]|uniref:Zinc-ribbon domain-containing protein n=1 Tax=Phytophthora nicotianae (strain INRA-310) TaxID=761204 RepID=W2PFB4_PHYN3|nr:hypothetical protein PPTG_19178 [Phytophthora nicotianae INRA-310]ETM98898.1 hypothetical protein PPTG_19178 [Phytophthora nicotianae INRA-310]
MDCLDDDATLEITGSRPTVSKRRSFSSTTSFAPNNTPQVTNLTSTAKFCIECGYELPPRVKFCIECGTSVRQQLMSPVSVDGVGTEVDRGNRGFRDSLGSNLMVIDEHSGSPTEPTDGSEDDAPTEQEPEETIPLEKKVEVETPETDDVEAKAKEFEELVAQLQAENEKLRNRVEKFKRKATEAERRRLEREEEHARAVSEATAAAAAAATAAAEVQANNRSASEPTTQAPADTATTSNGTGVAAKDHPDYLKFFKLLTMGLPAEQVKMKMQASGVDPSILDDPDAIIGGAASSTDNASTPTASGDQAEDEREWPESGPS